MQLDHERMDVYNAAIDLVPLTTQIADRIPCGHSSLGDQLRRATTSTCLNIAEGAGEFSTKEKARFYRMAKRSATESAAILDVVRVLDLPDEEDEVAIRQLLDAARGKIVSIVSMLVKMAKRFEEGPREGQGAGTGKGRGTGTHGQEADHVDCE